MAARFTGIILLLAVQSAMAGYGDAVDGRPSMPERDMTVATNMVRADPRGFRNIYIEVDTILLAANYWAVDPLYHYPALDQSARNHAVDMATNQGMSHTSSDGTTFFDRVTALYTNWNYIGENVATGVADGLSTVIQLLRDDIYPTDHPASDSSDGDGHRQNIMAPYFTETGAGYAYGPSILWYHFWCQDLGRRFSPAANTRIPAGTHFELDSGTLSFMANYFDPGGSAPQSVSAVIDGTPHTMALHLGTASRGTWKYDTADSGYKTRYWFTCTDAAGTVTRYPATDTLLANPDADDPPSHISSSTPSAITDSRITISPFPATVSSIISLPVNSVRLSIYDNKGRLIRSITATGMISGMFNGLQAGIYHVHYVNQDGHSVSLSTPFIE